MRDAQEIPSDWIRSLPKAELHLHLEGTVSPETLVELSQRHDPRTLTLDEARLLYRYAGFSGFLMAFKAITERLRAAEDYELITYRMVESLAAQGVVHAEVYISVGVIHYWKRVDFGPLFEGIERGRLRAERHFGVTVYWIFDAVRHFGPEKAARVFREAAELKRRFPSVVGIGIGGDERQTGAESFRDLYLEAREAGLHLTAHAGETVGPEGVWAALNIGAERIGHALSAQDDEELMGLLAERQIPIEACISSNLRTGCCPAPNRHPVRRYFDSGLFVTLNSDDPALFESDLVSEYSLAARDFGFSREHLRELASNSIEASFLPSGGKLAFLRQIDQIK
jgi:aminodeoxyfutalosine deaminase